MQAEMAAAARELSEHMNQRNETAEKKKEQQREEAELEDRLRTMEVGAIRLTAFMSQKP